MEKNQVILCTDEDDQLEGVMFCTVVTAKKLFIDFLFSHPKNLGLDFESNRFKRKGVGKVLIEYVKNVCVENSYQMVECASLKSSKNFYLKMGFKVGKRTMTLAFIDLAEEKAKECPSVEVA